MGWTSFPSRGRATLDILKDEFTTQGFDSNVVYRVLDSALVGSTAYLVIERRYRDLAQVNGDPRADCTYIPDADSTIRFIAVVLTSRRRDPDGYDFAFKDMTESMGPCEVSCPLRLFDVASPLREPEPGKSNYAYDWRESVRAWHRARTVERKTKAALVSGTRIKLNRPLKFSDGFEGDSFEVRSVLRRGRNVQVFVNGSQCYRIKNLAEIGYTVL